MTFRDNPNAQNGPTTKAVRFEPVVAMDGKEGERDRQRRRQGNLELFRNGVRKRRETGVNRRMRCG